MKSYSEYDPKEVIDWKEYLTNKLHSIDGLTSKYSTKNVWEIIEFHVGNVDGVFTYLNWSPAFIDVKLIRNGKDLMPEIPTIIGVKREMVVDLVVDSLNMWLSGKK